MANEKYKITVTKDHLVFCSGHFISYENSKCERIHGHNYRAKIEIEGKLDENHYVFDFIALKHRTKEITDLLDHRMMLAKNNAFIEVREEGNRVCVKHKEKEWIFPAEDCVILPISDTTAEQLALYIGKSLLESLKKQHNYTPDILRVEVEESFGQSATCELQS